MKRRPVFILGNGPSLRGFDFAKKLRGSISFGMNLAFRYWHSIHWYPTYYSCLDEVVGMHHLDSIHDLIENRRHYGIRAFCLRRKHIQALDMSNMACVHDYERLLELWPFYFRGYWSATGSKTLAWASWLGYGNIILLGIDGNYIKYVENACHVTDTVLTLNAQPRHNPNYFFDAYQQAGDLYHVPLQNNSEFPYEDQLMGWHMVRPQLEARRTMVVNGNPNSKVDAFPKSSLEQAHRLLRRMRRHFTCFTQRPLHRPLPRSAGAVLDTLGLVMMLHRPKTGILLDIGSYHGKNCLRVLKRGWRVCAAEPDPSNLNILRRNLRSFSDVYVEQDAVSCVSGRTYPWYQHEDGRWNAMQDVVGKGVLAGSTKTVTVRDIIRRSGLETIDILLLDIVGFEFMALRGIPFHDMPPASIIVAWNDMLSLKLGSDMHDVGSFLLSQGYTVFMSELHPMPNPDLPRQWHRLVPYPARPTHPQAWGHFVAFRHSTSFKRLAAALRACIRHGASLPPNPLPPLPPAQRIPHVIRF